MRIVLGIEYQGASFHGWQRQMNATPSVQEVVESALSFVADSPVEVVCAGRTDAGVHACAQIVHFDTNSVRSPFSWKMGANTRLPATVRVLWAKVIDETFDARYSACARTYRYFIKQGDSSAFSYEAMTRSRVPLDASKMHEAAQCLIGEHDFSSFRASSCQARSPIRTVHYINIQQQGEYIAIEIKANAFLHNMVRNITGSLLHVGAGKQPVTWIKEVLEGRDRKLAAPLAPANGLYLCKVDYPARYEIPESPEGPWFYVPVFKSSA